MAVKRTNNIRELLAQCINPLIRSDSRYFSNSGSEYEQSYRLVINDDRDSANFGEWILKPKEVINLYEKIQSHRDSVDLQILLKKYALGDESALNKVQGIYADVTQMPKTLAEMYSKVQLGLDTFAELPVEIRKEYDNNPSKWFSALASGDFDKLIFSKFGEVSKGGSRSENNSGVSSSETSSGVPDLKGGVADE